MEKIDTIKMISKKYNICSSLATSIYEDLEKRDLLFFFLTNIDEYTNLIELVEDFYG